MTSIRRVTDENELVKLFPVIREDAGAIGIDWHEVNEAKLWRTLYFCMNNAAIFVAEIDGEVAGIHVLCAVESFWRDAITFANLIYYVKKNHRNSRIGLELLKAAKDFAGNAELTISVHSFEDVNRKDKFFERNGFVKVGGRYQNKESIWSAQ